MHRAACGNQQNGYSVDESLTANEELCLSVTAKIPARIDDGLARNYPVQVQHDTRCDVGRSCPL